MIEHDPGAGPRMRQRHPLSANRSHNPGGPGAPLATADASILSAPRLPAGLAPAYGWLKERIDAFVALSALLAAAPLFAVIAWLIRRESPGPVFFRQTRAGRAGRPFTLLKFRTMRLDTDPYGDSPQSGADPRLTRSGRRLRETSLDELPQLINVLCGEMALVGPRPLYMQQMAEWNTRQRRRLLVKPGLTGFAQVLGRGGLTVEDKLELDVQYVENVSLRTDLWIIWRTLRSLLRRGDIYEKQYSRTKQRRSAGS